MLFPFLWLPLFSTGSYSRCLLVCCPLVSLVLFSRSFVFLCLSVVSMFLGGIAFGLSYLVDERPGSYTDVCLQSRVSSRSALLTPWSSGALATFRGSAYVLLLHRPLQAPDFIVLLSDRQSGYFLF